METKNGEVETFASELLALTEWQICPTPDFGSSASSREFFVTYTARTATR